MQKKMTNLLDGPWRWWTSQAYKKETTSNTNAMISWKDFMYLWKIRESIIRERMEATENSGLFENFAELKSVPREVVWIVALT